MRREPPGATLQTTALVHEAWERLVVESERSYESRLHFMRAAALAMRRILVDRARRRRMKQDESLLLQVADPGSDPRRIDIMDLDEALSELEERDPRMSRIVQLRFFGGLTLAEIAEVEGTALRTLKRDWQVARLWLLKVLKDGAADS